jgi:hypothetical protein
VVKFNEEDNEEVYFKRHSWERKKTLKDFMSNKNKQKIEVTSSVNILEDYLRRNPNTRISKTPK